MFDHDGEPRGSVSIPRALKLEAAGRAVLLRRKGNIRACQMLRAPQDPRSLTTRNYSGQRYHFRERLADGHRLWQLKRLGKGTELLPIFVKVVTDCIAPLNPAPEGACQ